MSIQYRLNHIQRMPLNYMHKYPKLLLLFITFIAAYLLFYSRNYKPLQDFILSLGYSGTFVAGLIFAYGFTAAPATAIFLILAEHQNIYIASLIGGLGSLVGDLFIFSFIRSSFIDEIRKLSRENAVLYINHKTPNIFKKYLLPVVAGFIIASPLPDEIGVSLLAVSKNISMKIFSAISYMLNTAGIFVILMIGSAL
ncbi:hypothetical protein J4234_00140 [Candidatus Woesearchaeota archaeon]|nr:hypothetical protein [Candidatus Woesearchaeota archaeon]